MLIPPPISERLSISTAFIWLQFRIDTQELRVLGGGVLIFMALVRVLVTRPLRRLPGRALGI